jgi:Holliday junction resolvase RusA-like endonuclease
MIGLTINAEPVSQPRARASKRGRVYNKPGKVDGWRAQIVAAWKRTGHPPFVGAVAMTLDFFLTCRTTPEEDPRDGDNLEKAVLDALTDAGAWKDDRQVTHTVRRRLKAKPGNPGLVMTIEQA